MSALALIKTLHLLGFAGCLCASAAKNLLLRREEIRDGLLRRLLLLDRISGLSAVVIALSGLTMMLWLAKPTEIYLYSVLFWIKIGLFIAASAAVVSTKPMLHRAARAGVLHPTRATRAALAFDLSALVVIATLGWLVAGHAG